MASLHAEVQADPVGLTTRTYEEVLGNIHDAVYTLDPEGTITWVNEVAVEEFDGGYTRDELLGAPVTKILSMEDVERCADLIAELVSTDPEGSRRCEIELQTADGRTIPCDLHLALLPSEDGSFEGTLGVVRDITEQKRREQGLSVLNRVLRHNVRNELSVVLGGLERLKAGSEDAGPIVEEAIDRLLRTSEKARSVEVALRRGPVAGGPVDLGAIVANRATEAACEFPDARVDVTAPAGCWVTGNGLLDDLVDELLDNALRHAAREEPTVEVTVDSSAADGAWTELVVADDGPGIPAAELEALDADAESPLDHASGLGLWLVTWVVERLGGELTFETPESGGTTVRVRLPAAAPPGPDR